MAEERGWRALWRAGTGVWEGGGSARGSEGRPRGAGGGSPALEGVEGGSATLEGGEEAAARLRRAGSWRRQRDSGRRGGGGSAAPEAGEEAAARLWRAERRL